MLWMLPSALAMPEPIEDLGLILEAPTKGWFAQGIGAPTVAWSGTEYVMFFESRVDPPTSACDQAWVIGRATSKDGIDWTIDEEPVYLPSWSDTTSPEACAVAQPAVVYDGVDWHLFYSMWSVSTRPGHGWVTGEGIGHAVSSDGQTFRSVEAPTPIGAWGTSSWESPASSELFYTPTTPTALLVDDEIWIAATNGWRGPLLARYAIHTGEWLVTNRTPYVESGWSPALDCRPGGGVYYAEVRGDDGDRSVRRVESDDFTHWDHSDSIEASPFEDVRHLEGMWAGGVRLEIGRAHV